MSVSSKSIESELNWTGGARINLQIWSFLTVTGLVIIVLKGI